jgi:DNA (cytosine-5)-methyltransferase 1
MMGLADDDRLPENVGDALNLDGDGDGVAVSVVRFLAAHILEPILAANVLALEGATQ